MDECYSKGDNFFFFPATKKKFQYLNAKFCQIYEGTPDIPASEWFWPRLDRTRYVTLGLVTNQSYTGDDAFTHCSLRNSEDDIPRHKKEISYDQAFPRDVEKIDFKILISGRPGSGKTVLLNKLCKDWMKEACFKDVPVVILVPLRELVGVTTDVQLANIVSLHIPASEMVEVVRFIEECRGEGFCFALDGLDEYPYLDKRGDFITGLIRGNYLPKAAVVMTSRPTHSHLVKERAQKHIEIIGFLPPQIKEYISEYYIGNESKAAELLSYLHSHPGIMGMCFLPLHLAMTIYVHKSLTKESSTGISLPETETGIYWHFMKHTVIRHVKREREDEDTTITDLEDFELFLSEQTEQDQKAFATICQLAFESKLSSKLIFDSNDMKRVFKLTKGDVKGVKERGFGILSNYKKVSADGDMSIFSFQHLTIQEFLGAFHLLQVSQQERLRQIAEHGSRRDMREVWKFFCGLLKMKSVPQHLECYIELLQLNSKRRDGVLFLINCAFESQPDSTQVCQQLLSSLSGKINVSNITLDTPDCSAIGHVISKAHPELSELMMNYCHVGPDGIEALERQLEEVCTFDALRQMQ